MKVLALILVLVAALVVNGAAVNGAGVEAVTVDGTTVFATADDTTIVEKDTQVASQCSRCKGQKPMCGTTASGEKVLIACRFGCWRIM
jgi:hypothetical protein